MKIWNSYGTEHSLNLVIIGRFKEDREAERFEGALSRISEFLENNSEFEQEIDRFDDKTFEFLAKENLYSLSPQQLGHLVCDVRVSRDGKDIHIWSDDDVNAFISLLVHNGAKVEVFSAHDYPENVRE